MKILKNLVESFALGNAIKTGIIVAIVGETNVGKSTLFNQIIQENRSIISPIGGTTRDILEESIILKGIPFRFLDTAGIRKNVKDPIEDIGIRRTMKKIENSQLILYVFDSSLNEEKQQEMIDRIQNISKKNSEKIIFAIANKSDIFHFHDFIDIKSKVDGFFHISAKNGKGIQEMLSSLSYLFMKKLKKRKYIVLQSRHYESFKNSLNEMELAYDSLKEGVSEDLILIHIKCASNHLGEIIGEITSEDILKNIFSQFCIGK